MWWRGTAGNVVHIFMFNNLLRTRSKLSALQEERSEPDYKAN